MKCGALAVSYGVVERDLVQSRSLLVFLATRLDQSAQNLFTLAVRHERMLMIRMERNDNGDSQNGDEIK